jgi:hypothetical protein
MSYSQRRYAHILELNGQPLNPHHPRLLRRTASGHLFDPATPTMLSQPQAQKPVEAMILDLNGNPIRCGDPHPLLRRTASGYLFQPKPSHVPECELEDARSVTPDSPPDTASAMVPQRLEHKVPPPPPTSASASITRKHADKQLDMHVTLLAAPAKQAQVVEAREPLGRPHSVIAIIETASSENLHSNSDYYNLCTETNNCRSTLGERNVKLMIASTTPYTLRHVAQSSDLHRKAARQIVPSEHVVNSHTRRGGPVMVESQNPNGLSQGFRLATFAEHERFRREMAGQPRALIAKPVTPRPTLSSSFLIELPLPSPTATTVCGAEEYAVAEDFEETVTEVGAKEKGARPWSEDVWMQVARE